MKKSDVKIGMRVVPFRKTVPGWFNLNESHQWKISQENKMNFLYVVGWENEENCWCLSTKNEPDTMDSDFFRASDFRPYVEKR